LLKLLMFVDALAAPFTAQYPRSLEKRPPLLLRHVRGIAIGSIHPGSSTDMAPDGDDPMDDGAMLKLH
jgi:hypothetical protein